MRQQNFLTWCMVLFISICTISCNETTPIGTGIIDDENLLNTSVVDSFTLKVATVRTDSANSSDRTRSYLFGALNDPTFGKANASIYTQFLLRASNPNLGEMPKFDSLVLTLAYNGTTYGNLNSNNSVTVYELEEVLDPTETYYSNDIITHNPRIVGEKRNFIFQTTDSVRVTTVVDTNGVFIASRFAPHLRVKLSDELGHRLLNQIGDIAFENDKNFQQFFKGLYIVSESSNNAITFFDILSDQTKLSLYYTTDEGTLGILDFFMNLSTAVINRFDHDYTGTPIESVLSETASETVDFAYVQAMGGLDIKLEIPSLTQALLGNVAINKAELEVYQVASEGDVLFNPPLALGLVTENQTDGLVTVMSSTASGLRGDTLMVNGEMGVKYPIDIDLQRLQDYLDEPNEQFFSILPSNPVTSANRMVVGGPNHPNFPMKLRLIFTSIAD